MIHAPGAHRAVLLSHALLLATTVAWQVATRSGVSAWALGLVMAIPLLLPWPGLLRGHRYTHAWSTLCVLPCLIVALVESIANPAGRWWSGATLALCFCFFIATVLYLRFSRPLPAP